MRPDVIRTRPRRVREGAAEPAEARAGLPAGGRRCGTSVVPGQPTYGMAAVGEGKSSPGRRADPARRGEGRTRGRSGSSRGAERTRSPRRSSTRARRGHRRRSRRSSRSCASTRSRTRTTPAPGCAASSRARATSRMPSTQDGEEYYLATWTGISGDRFYRNAPGADFTTFSDDVGERERPRARARSASSTRIPAASTRATRRAFLGLIDNGLASAMSPAFGGWGGRYVWRQPRGETRPFWTQGGDSYPGNDSSRDTVIGVDGQDLHLRPGHDLALADGLPARLRRADGLDDQGAGGGRTTTRASS